MEAAISLEMIIGESESELSQNCSLNHAVTMSDSSEQILSGTNGSAAQNNFKVKSTSRISFAVTLACVGTRSYWRQWPWDMS